MSVFTPYSIWKSNYPEMKPGELLKIQNSFYIIIQVRHNRKAVSVTGTQTNYPLALDNNNVSGTLASALEDMTGNCHY